jgi:hypothetical protein
MIFETHYTVNAYGKIWHKSILDFKAKTANEAKVNATTRLMEMHPKLKYKILDTKPAQLINTHYTS